MTADDVAVEGPFGPVTRRAVIGSTLLAGAAFFAAPQASVPQSGPSI